MSESGGVHDFSLTLTFSRRNVKQCHLLDSSKSNYYYQKCGQDGKSLYKVMDGLLGRSQKSSLPAAKNTADSICEYFSTKMEKNRKDLDNLIATAPPRLESQPPAVKHTLATFREASEEEVHNVIMKSATISCSLVPIPTDILKRHITTLVPVITRLVNASLAKGVVPESFKRALVTPLLNKSTLDPQVHKNYRPVSNLPFTSKILERVVLRRLLDHLSDTKLHEPHQSAYRSIHSTEASLVRVSNDILISLDNKKAAILVLGLISGIRYHRS